MSSIKKVLIIHKYSPDIYMLILGEKKQTHLLQMVIKSTDISHVNYSHSKPFSF